MKKNLFIILILFFFNSTIFSIEIFTAIHCDPSEPHNFPLLETLVDSAESYNVSLTLEFTPQWADSILTIQRRKNLLKIWQSHGHEIALHHHGLPAPNYWDGYSNTSNIDSILMSGHKPDSLKGDMNDFYNLLSPLGEDSLILTFGCGDTSDWIDGIPFQNDGNLVEHTGLPLSIHNYNGNIVKKIGQAYLGTNKTFEDLRFLYNKNKQCDTIAIGAVFHVHNFASSQDIYINWFKFLDGKENKTVRNVCRYLDQQTSIQENPSKIQFGLPVLFPNPLTDNDLNIALIIPEDDKFTVSIFDILGRNKIKKISPLYRTVPI